MYFHNDAGTVYIHYNNDSLITREIKLTLLSLSSPFRFTVASSQYAFMASWVFLTLVAFFEFG